MTGIFSVMIFKIVKLPILNLRYVLESQRNFYKLLISGPQLRLRVSPGINMLFKVPPVSPRCSYGENQRSHKCGSMTQKGPRLTSSQWGSEAEFTI